MSRYSLSVSAPLKMGADNKTIALLTDDLTKLADEFGGHVDLTYRSTSTSYRRRHIDLVDRDHLLEGKVRKLKEQYSGAFVMFTFAEYTRA